VFAAPPLQRFTRRKSKGVHMAREVSLRMMLLVPILSAMTASAFAQVTPQGRDRNPQTTVPQNAPAAKQRSPAGRIGATAQNSNPVMEAMEISAAEVEAGKLAMNRAQDARVKNFAAMMVKDHNEALTRLKSLHAAPSDVKPSANHKQTADRLATLSGAEFDRAYMDAMVGGHEAAIKFFEKNAGEKPSANSAAADTEQQDFSTLAQELLPTVRRHLEAAKEIQNVLERGNSGSNPAANDDGPSKLKPKNPIHNPDPKYTPNPS